MILQRQHIFGEWQQTVAAVLVPLKHKGNTLNYKLLSEGGFIYSLVGLPQQTDKTTATQPYLQVR